MLKILDGYHFSSLEEVEMSLERMKIVDGCHFSSLKEVEEGESQAERQRGRERALSKKGAHLRRGGPPGAEA